MQTISGKSEATHIDAVDWKLFTMPTQNVCIVYPGIQATYPFVSKENFFATINSAEYISPNGTKTEALP